MSERVLTIRQPWADLIMAGVKDVENRTWPVPSTLPHECSFCDARSLSGPKVHHRYIGCSTGHVSPFPFRLWVHAAKRDDLDQGGWFEWCRVHELNSADFGPVPDPDEDVVRGALLGAVTVTGCHHADECRETRSAYWPGRGERWETFCSRWAEPDVWHWTLANQVQLVEPIPMRGSQGLWTLDLALAEPA